MRTPISKQRNKHIQKMLVEAARMAPRFSDKLATVYERERQRGNANRATLAVARKMVAHMLAVDRRKTDFIAATAHANRSSLKNLPNKEKHQDQSMRRLLGPAHYRPSEGGNSGGPLRIVSGLAENTNSIFCDGSS
jgi:hypothetical protein